MTSNGKKTADDQTNDIKKQIKAEGYIILDHIAHGSFGEVRHAKYITDEKNELNLVVKIIDTKQINQNYVSKFLPRELDIIQKINHPYIIHTHSILQKRAVLYLFMTFAEKGELLKYIMDYGPLKENQACIWFRQLALAIQYLHTMDIVHRDIKCENILISEHDTVKLSDFSFSKFIPRAKRLNCSTVCYSLYYGSPEIISRRPYDGKASDIWSLGVVLYMMLNNKKPFYGKTLKTIYKKQVKQDWNHQPIIEELISDNLKICIKNLLQPEPQKRWKIDQILESDWIKMNRTLSKMNEQESLAFLEALKSIKTATNQKHLKKIEAYKSDTQQILKEQLPRFPSVAQNSESTSSPLQDNIERNESINELR